MSHIHTGPGQHDHTISIYLIRADREEPKVVFHLHRKFGRYVQFGGHIELNETTWAAVARELKEETGYALDQVRLLQPKLRLESIEGSVVHPQPIVHNTIWLEKINHGHTDTAYAFITSEEPRFELSEDESGDFKEFTLSELQDIEDGITDSIARDIALYILGHSLTHWEEVDPKNFPLVL